MEKGQKLVTQIQVAKSYSSGPFWLAIQQAAAQLLSILAGAWTVNSIGRSVTIGQGCLDIMVIFFTRGSSGSPRPGTDVCTHRKWFLQEMITTKCQNHNRTLTSIEGTITVQVLKRKMLRPNKNGMVANYVPNLLYNAKKTVIMIWRAKNAHPTCEMYWYLSSLVHNTKMKMTRQPHMFQFSIIVESLP